MKIKVNRRKPWVAKYCRKIAKGESEQSTKGTKNYYLKSPDLPYVRKRVIRGWKLCPFIINGTEHSSCKHACISTGMMFLLGTHRRRWCCPNKTDLKTGEWSWFIWRPVELTVKRRHYLRCTDDVPTSQM